MLAGSGCGVCSAGSVPGLCRFSWGVSAAQALGCISAAALPGAGQDSVCQGQMCSQQTLHFRGRAHFSQLSEAKIRRETGNYLVWVEFISVPAHHSSFLSLSWDIPAPILNPAEPSGNLPVVPNLEVLLLWGHFGGSSPSQGAPHRLCASVPTLKLKWGRPSAAILLFPFV